MEKKIFLSIFFSILSNSGHFEFPIDLIWTNFKLLEVRTGHIKFGWNWPALFRDFFLIFTEDRRQRDNRSLGILIVHADLKVSWAKTLDSFLHYFSVSKAVLKIWHFLLEFLFHNFFFFQVEHLCSPINISLHLVFACKTVILVNTNSWKDSTLNYSKNRRKNINISILLFNSLSKSQNKVINTFKMQIRTVIFRTTDYCTESNDVKLEDI